MKHLRDINQYDAAADLKARFPSWKVEVRTSGPAEQIDAVYRTIQVNPPRSVGYALAHAVAHLDLGHACQHGRGRFSPQQEADAHWLAELRMDEGDSRECA